MDAWIRLEQVKIGGERNRTLHIVKSRGMQHSNQVREFLITGRGIELREAYLGPSGVVTGSARAALESREELESARRSREGDRIRMTIARRKKLLEARVALLEAEFDLEEKAMLESVAEAEEAKDSADELRETMSKMRISE